MQARGTLAPSSVFEDYLSLKAYGPAGAPPRIPVPALFPTQYASLLLDVGSILSDTLTDEPVMQLGSPQFCSDMILAASRFNFRRKTSTADRTPTLKYSIRPPVTASQAIC
ncbi:hypothetical protein MHYP_G00242450 [Metynnis hypsauchen]